MSTDLQTALARLDLYLERVKLALESGNRAKALSDLAELQEISRRLWEKLAKSSRR
jgi:hypothetical protein